MSRPVHYNIVTFQLIVLVLHTSNVTLLNAVKILIGENE
jgi:hypothetical protein